MTEQIVREWLADFSTLSHAEVHSFAAGQAHNQELINALHAVLEERNKYQELVDPVCDQLFGYYRSLETELKHFALQFLPTIIFVYLNAVAHGDKKSCRSVETLLIGMYNLEVVDENGQPKVVTYRFPSLAQASIYHEPMSLAPASLTESSLKRLEECNTNLVTWGPLLQVESLNAQNRLKVMTAVLFVYNRYLSVLPKHALQQLCKVTSKLVTQGFSKIGHQKRSSYGSDSTFVPRLLPRIPVSSPFLLQLLHAVYFAITYPRHLTHIPHLLTALTPTFYCHFSRFNDFAYIGTQALEDIYHRAAHELYPEVLLVTGAIKNSLNVNPSGQPSDGPMGISVALSPSTATATVSKCMITNASFRTKKLPDDIPLVESPQDNSSLVLDSLAKEGKRTPMSLLKQLQDRSRKLSQSPKKSEPTADSIPELQVEQIELACNDANDSSDSSEEGSAFFPYREQSDSPPPHLQKKQFRESTPPYWYSHSKPSTPIHLHQFRRNVSTSALDFETSPFGSNVWVENGGEVRVESEKSASLGQRIARHFREEVLSSDAKRTGAINPTNDIPIQTNDSDGKNLTAISEEREDEMELGSGRLGSMRTKNTSKLSNLPGFTKKKDKDSEKRAKNGEKLKEAETKKSEKRETKVSVVKNERGSLMNGESDFNSGVSKTSSRSCESAIEKDLGSISLHVMDDSLNITGGESTAESLYSDSMDLSNSLDDVIEEGTGDGKVLSSASHVTNVEIGNGSFHSTTV